MANQDDERIVPGSIRWPETLGNTRAPEQFRQIVKAIDLRDRKVFDLGAGYGDLAWALQQIGATVTCVDVDPTMTMKLLERGLHVFTQDVEEFVTWYDAMDVVVCFSVLPYLQNPQMFLQRLRLRANVLLLECQYHGDGPGLAQIENDADMKFWLEFLDWKPKIIGKTFVPGRDLWRTIWMCTKG